MRTYDEALEHSKQNPYELVEFKKIYPNMASYLTGFFLNGKFEGINEYYCSSILQHRDICNSKTSHTEHLRFRSTGTVSNRFFRRGAVTHGECVWFNEDGSVNEHYFYNSGSRVKELDEILDAERDDAFYFTLSLYDIEKEYTFQ